MAPPLLFFLLLSIQTLTSSDACQDSCSRYTQEIRFPFGFIGKRDRCSYPGFNLLSCSTGDQTQTILTLPRSSNNFVVQLIDYQSQSLYIRDSENCLAKRFLDSSFDLLGSPFLPEHNRTFAFLKCLSNVSLNMPPGFRRVDCLSNETYTVIATPRDVYEDYLAVLQSCTLVSKTVSVPVSWPNWSEGHTRLLWNRPDCRPCEQRGGTCGFKSDTGLDLGCSGLQKNGLPRSAKYGLIIGVGIPGLLCIIGVACYLCGRVRTYIRRRRHPFPEISTSIAPQPTILVTGLDGLTIESFPKTELGESRRLPNPNDNTCPICLSEYQPKETLRTIPECNHYFHAKCIDEWLGMNATCPLCRNSPEGSSLITPSSSVSSSSSSLSAP